MAEGRVIRNQLQYSIDRAKLTEALQGSERLRDRIRDLAAATKQTGVVSQSTARQLLEQARAMAALDKGTRAATEQYEKLTQSIKRSNDEQAKTGAGSKINTGSALSGAAGLVGSVGGSAAAEPLRVLGDIEGVVSSLGSLGPLAAVSSVGLLAVGAAFTKMNSDLEPARQTLEGAITAQRNYYDLLREGTTQTAQERIAQLKAQADSERAIIAESQNATASAFANAQQTYGDLAARLAFAVTDADDKVNKTVTDSQTALSAYEQEIKRLEQGLSSGAFAANDMTAREAELSKAREAAIPRLQQLAEQAARLQQEAAERENDINQERRTRDERDQFVFDRQQQRQARSHQDQLTKIGLQGVERLAEIRQQGNARLASIEATLTKIRENFMASERERTRKFYDQEKRLAAQNQRDRLRRIEDLNDALFDAEISNNVLLFQEAQRQGEKDLRRMAEDADTATQERTEQFLEESRLARERYAQEIAAQDAAKREVLAGIQSQLDAEKARLTEAKKAAQEQFAESQKLAAEDRALRLKYQAEDDRTADQRRRAALDKSLADIDAKARKEAEAIGIIGTALTNLITAVQNGATAAIARIIGSASSSLGSSSSDPRRGGGASFSSAASSLAQLRGQTGRSRVTAFAPGGIATKPMLGVVGERPGFHEAMIPYKPSEGIERAIARLGIGGGDTYYNINIGDIGNGMSKADVVEVVKAGIRESYKGIMDARRPT